MKKPQTNKNANAANAAQIREELGKVWSNAKLDRVGIKDLLWLTDVIACFPPIAKRNMSETLNKYRKGYQSCVAASGRKSLNNGDDVALFLDGMTNVEVLQAAERILGFEDGELQERYAHLNTGAQRMNGGNLLRGALKRLDITADDLH